MLGEYKFDAIVVIAGVDYNIYTPSHLECNPNFNLIVHVGHICNYKSKSILEETHVFFTCLDFL